MKQVHLRIAIGKDLRGKDVRRGAFLPRPRLGQAEQSGLMVATVDRFKAQPHRLQVDLAVRC